MPGLRQIHYLWVCRKSSWGIDLLCTAHTSMSPLQATWVSSFPEPCKSILSWWDSVGDQLMWCHKRNSHDFENSGCGYTHVFLLPIFSSYFFSSAPVPFMHGSQSLWGSSCPGMYSPWVTVPLGMSMSWWQSSMGCSPSGVSLPYCVSLQGHSSFKVSPLWAAVPSEVYHLFHGAPLKSSSPSVPSVMSLSMCLLCFSAPSSGRSFLNRSEQRHREVGWSFGVWYGVHTGFRASWKQPWLHRMGNGFLPAGHPCSPCLQKTWRLCPRAAGCSLSA